jgi:hypothetical protein
MVKVEKIISDFNGAMGEIFLASYVYEHDWLYMVLF